MAREIGPQGAPEAPLTDQERQRIVMRFAVIEMIGIVPLLAFLIAFFVLDLFPGQPTWMLVTAIGAFFCWGLASMWLSGFFRLMGQPGGGNGR